VFSLISRAAVAILLAASPLTLSLPPAIAGDGTTRPVVERPLGIGPPAPIACRGRACKPDAAQLKAFLIGFYAWYVDRQITSAAMSGGRAAREKYDAASDRTLDSLLAPGFAANLAKLRRERDAAQGEEPAVDPSLWMLCGGVDADSILCAQDYSGDWRTDATVVVTAHRRGAADLTVTLPWAADPKTGRRPPPHRLIVAMKAIDRVWRIDRISVAGP